MYETVSTSNNSPPKCPSLFTLNKFLEKNKSNIWWVVLFGQFDQLLIVGHQIINLEGTQFLNWLHFKRVWWVPHHHKVSPGKSVHRHGRVVLPVRAHRWTPGPSETGTLSGTYTGPPVVKEANDIWTFLWLFWFCFKYIFLQAVQGQEVLLRFLSILGGKCCLRQ